MPTFVSLVNFTGQGVQNVQESPKRAEAFRAMAADMGLKVEAMYYTLGQYDMVVIVEGPEDAVMASLLKVSSLGNIRMQTLKGFSVDDMKGFISKMP